ncbi:MAG: hypothetical protein ACO363_06860, partial [Balneolaceae bacterium]
TLLRLTGEGDATVTGLIGDVDSSALSGALDITTADNTDADAIARIRYPSQIHPKPRITHL